MNTSLRFPSEEKAHALLQWASEKNPGPWVEHGRVAARAAKVIAEKCGLDTNRAYVSGLLHDIGRYEGVRDLHHVYAGYDLMLEKGHNAIAEICLSHSFPVQDIGAYSGKNFDCTHEELSVIEKYLSEAEYSDYDKLIQLCDAISLPQGVCLIDVRLVNIVRRHGFNDFTLRKWDAFFALKKHFDTLCNMNVYDLFYNEIRMVSIT